MIAEMVQGIMRKGIVRMAQQRNLETSQVQLRISWAGPESGETLAYDVITNTGLKDRITFNQFLGVKFDMMNREGIMEAFTTKALVKYGEELQCPISHLFVIICLDEEAEEDIKLYLFKGKEFIREIDLEKMLL